MRIKNENKNENKNEMSTVKNITVAVVAFLEDIGAHARLFELCGE